MADPIWKQKKNIFVSDVIFQDTISERCRKRHSVCPFKDFDLCSSLIVKKLFTPV